MRASRYLWALFLIVALTGCVRRETISAATATPVTRYYAYVYGTARDTSGRAVANVTVTVNGKSSTTNASGEWGVTPAVTVGERYTFEVAAPDGWYLTQWPQSFVASEPPDPIGPFAIVLAPIPAPQPTATIPPVPVPPTDTPTTVVTATPVASSTPTAPMPPGTPTPTPKCYGFQQFSFAERWTILSTGAALIGRDIGEVIDWQNDETLAYAIEINLGAPLTRPYTVTATDGSFIWCRAFCQGVIAIRQVWPCESERYGVVQWDGFENWTKGGS